MANSKILRNPGVRRYPKNQQEWNDLWNEIAKFFADSDDITTVTGLANTAQSTANTAQTSADTAQTTAEAAEESTYYAVGNPATFVWNSDTSGVFPAGDPTRDLVMTFHDPDGNAVATRTLRGTLTSADGTIAVTNVSSTGLTTSYNVVADGTTSVRADVTVTLSSGKQITAGLAWSSLDESTAGGTPVSGGSK